MRVNKYIDDISEQLILERHCDNSEFKPYFSLLKHNCKYVLCIYSHLLYHTRLYNRNDDNSLAEFSKKDN